MTDVAGCFRQLKISGTPLWDPKIGSPFTLLNEPDLIEKLPRTTKKASIITGSIAAPFIRDVLLQCGSGASVVPVKKDIACLVTIEDLRDLDLSTLEKTVIIPGRAFVHDREASVVLSADGIDRVVVRGPEMLTADAETSMGMTRREVLSLELEGFADLIRVVNQYGQPG